MHDFLMGQETSECQVQSHDQTWCQPHPTPTKGLPLSLSEPPY